MLRWLYRTGDRLRHKARLRGNQAHAWGKRGEDIAHRLLQRKGCIVIARNYRTRNGSAEVDLIVRDGDTLVFVEVKTRKTDRFGAPEEAVDHEKRRKIIRGASDYLFHLDQPGQRVRFDIVSVMFGDGERVEHFADAFSPDRNTAYPGW